MPLFYEILKVLKSCDLDDLYLAGSTLKTIFCFFFVFVFHVRLGLLQDWSFVFLRGKGGGGK